MAGPGKKWSPEEEALLRKMAPVYPVRELARYLPGRTYRAILEKMRKSGIDSYQEVNRPAWSKREDDILYYATQNASVDYAVRHIGRSRNSVCCRASYLGYHWSKGKITAERVAKILGVAPTTVRNYRRKLGQAWRWAGRTSEARDDHIQEIAQALLDNQRSTSKVSARRLRAVARGDWDSCELHEKII